LQSNKCKSVASISNIYAVQTVDSVKKARLLNQHIPADRTEPLFVYIQVNTSDEDQKSGVQSFRETEDPAASALSLLALTIVRDCPRLTLAGLMTIGSFESSNAIADENPDFAALVKAKDLLETILRADSSLPATWGGAGRLGLSMGMSADYELAVRMGSDIVRVGTSIFGQRPPKDTDDANP